MGTLRPSRCTTSKSVTKIGSTGPAPMTAAMRSTTRRSRRYPDLQLIATAPIKSVKPDVLDEHFYMSAEKSFSDANHYDKTDRNGPKIFVGEWATREGEPTPNLQAALADAAWMTGMERNSDIVIMSAMRRCLST